MFQPGSPLAQPIADLFILTLAIAVLVVVLIIGLVGTAWARYRQRGEGGEPEQTAGHVKLETTWTVAPALLLVGLFVLTVGASRAADPVVTQNDQPTVVIIGHQWWWEVQYPQATITTANEIHLPVGQRVLGRFISADVIHDFWVPDLSRKMDMLPDGSNFMWLQAGRPGVYEGACAEYCGTEHAWMRIKVIADAPADFARWQQAEAAPPAPEAAANFVRGARLFQDKTCVSCHRIGPLGKAVGPDLTHLGSRTTLGAGILANTPENLARWLRDPQMVKPGILMPNVKLTPDEINDLTAYLEALK